MLIVADTSPLNYLILIDEANVLERLYGRVIVPSVVHEELLHGDGPEKVREWARILPGWIEVREPVGVVPLRGLHLGEAMAIALVMEMKADRLLIDEKGGRKVAMQLGIEILGTAGILREGAQAGLVDLRTALEQLKRTTFRAAPEFFAKVLWEFEHHKEQL